MRKLFISFFIKFFLVQMKLVINLLLPKNFKSDNDLTIKTHLINFTKYINRYIFDKTKFKLKTLYDPVKKTYYCEVGDDIYLNTHNNNRFFKMDSDSKIINQAEYFVKIIDKTNKKNIVDIGSYIGELSIFFAKRYPDAKILSVEGSKTNYAIQKDNIAFNNISNILAVNNVLAEKEKEVFITENLDGENFIKDTLESNCSKTNSVTLLSLLEKYNIENIDFLKIDLEGSVHLLTKDLIQLKNKKLIKFCHLEFAKNKFEEIEDLLKSFSNDSEIFIVKEYQDYFEPINADNLKKILQKNLIKNENKFAIDVLFKF